MIDLTPYLNILGLPPDATWDQVEQRYRTLVIFWHPDRVSSPHHKALAEEELKKINNAKYKLKQHWRDWQNRPRSSTSNSQGSSSRANSAKDENAEKKNQDKKRADEQSKRKRESESRRREEQSQKQQKDFEAAYQQYSSSREEEKRENAKNRRIGLRLLRVALIVSAGQLVLATIADSLTNHWIRDLETKREYWSTSYRDTRLMKRQ